MRRATPGATCGRCCREARLACRDSQRWLDCPFVQRKAPMPATIDYYFAPNSPYVYLGHERFVRIAREAGATIVVKPVDLGGKVFPVSGGLPLSKRAPQRQAYRLVELKRFSQWLGLPL